MRTIKIDNKEYPLSFNANYYLKLEQDYGIKMTMYQQLIEDSPMDFFIKLIHTSMQVGARVAKQNFE